MTGNIKIWYDISLLGGYLISTWRLWVAEFFKKHQYISWMLSFVFGRQFFYWVRCQIIYFISMIYFYSDQCWTGSGKQTNFFSITCPSYWYVQFSYKGNEIVAGITSFMGKFTVSLKQRSTKDKMYKRI